MGLQRRINPIFQSGMSSICRLVHDIIFCEKIKILQQSSLPLVNSSSMIQNTNEYDFVSNVHVNQSAIIANAKFIVVIAFVVFKVFKRIFRQKTKLVLYS